MTDSNQAVTFNPNEIRYLNDKEVSKITGKAVATLRNERSKRIGINFIKAGGKVVYDLQDIVKYMNDRRILTEQ
jgi:hypothetical protein